MPAAFSQAAAAIKISSHFGMRTMICMYEKYAIYHIASICAGSTDINRLLSPKLKKLMEYDYEHNVSFTRTLECYFRHSRNITDTAAALHLHRNSVVYHLNKIQELLGFSFDDSHEMLLLELSLRLNEYNTKSLPDYPD